MRGILLIQTPCSKASGKSRKLKYSTTCKGGQEDRPVINATCDDFLEIFQLEFEQVCLLRKYGGERHITMSIQGVSTTAEQRPREKKYCYVPDFPILDSEYFL